MIDTSDPYSAFEQHQRVGCVTCCLSAEITQRSQGLGLFPLCCSRELAGTTICCSLLLDTGLGRGLLTELGTPKQGDGRKKVLCHQHRAKLVSSVVPQWPPARECDVGTVDILTLEMHGARQQWVQDTAASCLLHACDGMAKAGSFSYEMLEVMPPVQASVSP